jgi:hypothetical protein
VLTAPAHSAAGGTQPRLQRLPGRSMGNVDAPPASVDQALATPGRPLESSLRQDMEQRFGHDFSRVRVHFGAAAELSTRQLNASAYTVGDEIVFGAGRFAPGTTEGKCLLAHELTHVVQQHGGAGKPLQRAPGGAPDAPVKAVEPLEVVAQRIARLAIGPGSAAVNLKGGPGKVISVTRNVRTGQIYVGLNTGVPAKMTEPIQKAVQEQARRVAAGEVKVTHTAVDAVGGHAEVNALNQAIADEQAVLGRTMTAEEIATTFEMHNVWLSGSRRQLTTAPRCEHCAAITRGVKVTESLFKAEFKAGGGVSGEINVPQRGQAVKAGGKVVEAETIHGKIPAPKPTGEPSGAAPERVPEVTPEVEVPGVGSAGKATLRLAITEIALNVLLFAVAYYLNKWHAEKQVRKFNNDIKGLLPEVNDRLKKREAEILEKSKAFPLVYGNITIVYTHDRYEPEDYNEGSMSIQNVDISHQNYQTPERLIKAHDPISRNDPSYSLTFSVPLFDEKTAEKGASSLVLNYRRVRDNLTDPAYKVRLSAVITLYRLVLHDSSLRTLVIRDLLGMLKDQDSSVRLTAAVFLSRLRAKIAIPYIQDVLRITSDDKHQELIQRYLRELEQG